ncbi:MAG: hypothetical protein ACK4F6_17290, partial [Hylemonella sp.]
MGALLLLMLHYRKCCFAGMCPRQGSNFLLLRQKKVTADSKAKCNDGLDVDILLEAIFEEHL